MEPDAPDNLIALTNQHRAQIEQDLRRVCENPDPIFQELAFARISEIADSARALSHGEVVYRNTEAWRAAYEKLLLSLDFSVYRSVAWVKSSDYWRDSAGRHSIRLNYDLLDRGLKIERILILPSTLWSVQDTVPGRSIITWIEEQHYRGISLWLVREDDVTNEPDIVRDFGIYGNRATGEQELDEESRTIYFRLAFSPAAVQRAERRWEQLLAFSISCSQALDL